jgi:dTDP-4-dehydrorhamnose 3,5-epimerase
MSGGAIGRDVANGDAANGDAASDTAPLSRLPGVAIERLVRHADPRGSLREVWRASWYPALDPDTAGRPDAAFAQANVSVSAAGVLRGLHLHRHQLDHWVLLEGRAHVALVDVRPMLAGAHRPLVETHELGADHRITIPIGVAHGFLALEPLVLLYLVTNEYDGSDELGFAWDDPIAAVPWPAVQGTPDGKPVLSDRDRANPPLAELVDRLRA